MIVHCYDSESLMKLVFFFFAIGCVDLLNFYYNGGAEKVWFVVPPYLCEGQGGSVLK